MDGRGAARRHPEAGDGMSAAVLQSHAPRPCTGSWLYRLQTSLLEAMLLLAPAPSCWLLRTSRSPASGGPAPRNSDYERPRQQTSDGTIRWPAPGRSAPPNCDRLGPRLRTLDNPNSWALSAGITQTTRRCMTPTPHARRRRWPPRATQTHRHPRRCSLPGGATACLRPSPLALCS
eukprot:362218-Chlamydomonas_euryale.AAC.3